MVPPLVRPGYESDMPAFGDKLTNEEIRAVLAFIRSHWSDDVLRKREELLEARRDDSRNPGKVLKRLQKQ